MKLNLKQWPNSNKIKLIINDKDEFEINDDFSNVFTDDFIKFILNNCNTIEELNNNELTIDEESFKNSEQEIKNKLSVLQQILQQFINGLNENKDIS